jgi:predicted HAD superfamily Cof-like phosphohydrolase
MTHKVQRDVRDFHLACRIPIGDSPAIRRGQLRADLIMEEAVETAEAATGRVIHWRYEDDPEGEWFVSGSLPGPPDLVGYIDGLCDLICVAYGSALEAGVDLEPFWDEVHRSNMAKAGGPVREDGKVLKPPGWVPPDIAGILAAMS